MSILRRALFPMLPLTLLLALLGAAQEPTPSERTALEAYRAGNFDRAATLYEQALRETVDPAHRAQLHVRIAWTLFALGRQEGVETHLRAALVDDPGLALVPDYYTREFLELFESVRRNPLPSPGDGAAPSPELEATLATIEARLQAGEDLEGALADARQLWHDHPGDQRLLALQLQLLEQLGRTDEAERLRLEAAAAGTVEPANAIASLSLPELILRANRLLDEGDQETALALLREAVARQPSNVAALELLAEGAQRAGRWQEAEFALKSALAYQPDNLELRLRLGDVELAQGNTSAALDAFQQLTQRFPQSDRAWAAVGLLYARLGRSDHAREHLERALEENPLLPEVQLALAELLLARGEAAPAVRALRSAGNLLPDDPQLEARLGQGLLVTAGCEQALPHLEAAVHGGFAPPDVQQALALALLVNGDLAAAERVLHQPEVARAVRSDLLQALLDLLAGRPGEAETVLEAAVRERPDDASAYALLGVARYRQGAWGGAVQALERARALAGTPDPVLERNLELARAAEAAARLQAEARQVGPTPVATQ